MPDTGLSSIGSDWPASFRTGEISSPIRRLICPLLSTTFGNFNPFYQSIESLLLGVKCVFKHYDLQIFGPSLTSVSNFHLLKCCGSA